MGNIPFYSWNNIKNTDSTDGLTVRSDNPVLRKVMEARRTQFRHLQDQDSYWLERIVTRSRVLIIEGISGSGKDTFQAYLKEKLRTRDVYEYSEGELLQSWKQLHIEGVSKLRVKFMKLFATYLKEIIGQDKNAVFLLNRFHLSTYVSVIARQPKLEREYNEVVKVLRTLPVHMFILQLDEKEIEERGSHPERGTPWLKHQERVVKKEGFPDALGRHIWQQALILDAAEKQQIPYSIIKFPSSPDIEAGIIRTPETPSNFTRGVRRNFAGTKIPRRRQRVPQPLAEDS